MKRSVREFVRSRARKRCEYCRIHERHSSEYAFHIEHIISRKHHGTDDPENLAWACIDCNLGKGTNLSGRDPDSERVVVLFHPRHQEWHRHFELVEGRILGKTACGRATADVLNLNEPDRVKARKRLMELGELSADDE